jgi:hypothetical protein
VQAPPLPVHDLGDLPVILEHCYLPADAEIVRLDVPPDLVGLVTEGIEDFDDLR